MSLISVQLHVGQHDVLLQKLEVIRKKKQHLFPGTVMRYIAAGSDSSERVFLLFVWRGTVIPDEKTREEALEEFRRSLDDVLDWSTAQDCSRFYFLTTLASHHSHIHILYFQVEAINVIHQIIWLSVSILSQCITYLVPLRKEKLLEKASFLCYLHIEVASSVMVNISIQEFAYFLNSAKQYIF